MAKFAGKTFVSPGKREGELTEKNHEKRKKRIVEPRDSERPSAQVQRKGESPPPISILTLASGPSGLPNGYRSDLEGHWGLLLHDSPG